MKVFDNLPDIAPVKVKHIVEALEKLTKNQTLLIEPEDWPYKSTTPQLYFTSLGNRHILKNYQDFHFPLRKTVGIGWYIKKIK